MFRIGEFAQIAQVSGRQLRYYDQLGLLTPVRTDPETGYRYYSAAQLPRLNRILALKELGLSLDQIAGLLDRDIQPTELRGMLMMKRAQVEQSLHEEEVRLRQIESRIRQIDEQGAMRDYDVVVKAVPERPFLSLRSQFETMDEAVALLGRIVEAGRRGLRAGLRDQLVVVAHNDFEAETLDLEAGFTLARPTNRPLRLDGGLALTAGRLPAVEAMATLVRSGPGYESHSTFGALGVWMEANGYQVDGPCREVFLEPPFQPGRDPVVEIQFPIRRAA